MGKAGYRCLRISEHPECRDQAASWFHEKWGISEIVYIESMSEGIMKDNDYPEWYVIVNEEDHIVAGAGIITNDFHERIDLTPNVCAVYVEESDRHQGLAKRLLDQCRTDAGKWGYPALYLITDHTEFYEHCGWEFQMMVGSSDGTARLYKAETFDFQE